MPPLRVRLTGEEENHRFAQPQRPLGVRQMKYDLLRAQSGLRGGKRTSRSAPEESPSHPARVSSGGSGNSLPTASPSPLPEAIQTARYQSGSRHLFHRIARSRSSPSVETSCQSLALKPYMYTRCDMFLLL